jgi:hypothetical protein
MPDGVIFGHRIRGSHPFALLQHRKEQLMLDVIMLAVGLGFFALAVGYTIACARL